MPTYNYVCFQCGYEFETVLSIKDHESTLKCPNCDALAYQKMMPVAFTMKRAGRAYHQWKGDPAKCPEDVKEMLKKQDRPKGVSIYAKENEPQLGSGSEFNPKRQLGSYD